MQFITLQAKQEILPDRLPAEDQPSLPYCLPQCLKNFFLFLLALLQYFDTKACSFVTSRLVAMF
jgi:hypothetical protein